MEHETATMAPQSGMLDVPGARLYYEVRGSGPLIVAIGSPMDARSFAPLADLLAVDHTVLTADPRGIFRSSVDDREQDSTPQIRAVDVAALIRHVDAGPATVLGSSGGAVTALALVEAHPEVVHTIVAHEPPVNELLDDRAELRAAMDDVVATCLAGDPVTAWRKFLDLANIQMPEEVFQHAFGGERDEQQAADEHFGFVHEMRPTTLWKPDVERLRAAPVRIVVGIGEESGGEVCERTSLALTAELGLEPTWFPGGHTGFVDDPTSFAARLRSVLS